MYGLDPDNIERFAYLCGGEVTSICVGKFDLHFGLHPRGRLTISGRCELQDDAGGVVDAWDESGPSDKFLSFIDLLGAVVAGVAIEDSITLRLRFTNGRQLVLRDDSSQYESYAIDDEIV